MLAWIACSASTNNYNAARAGLRHLGKHLLLAIIVWALAETNERGDSASKGNASISWMPALSPKPRKQG